MNQNSESKPQAEIRLESDGLWHWVVKAPAHVKLTFSIESGFASSAKEAAEIVEAWLKKFK